MAVRYQKTEFGIKTAIFSQRYGITLKDIAHACGLNYNTFLQMRIGKTTGEKVDAVAKVEAYMSDYAARTAPDANVAMRPFKEVT